MVGSRPRMTSGIIPVLLSLGILLGLLAGCSQKEEFTPYLTGGLGSDNLFVRDTFFVHTLTVPGTVYGPTDSSFELSASLGKNAGNTWNSRKLVVCNWRNYLSRCFLRFSELPDRSDSVTSATLFLYATRIEGPVGKGPHEDVFGIYALADSLDQENLTWGTMPALGERITGLPLAADSVAADVTGIVSAWVKGESPNLGFAIRLDDEAGPEAIVEFASREDFSTRAVGDTNVYVRPALRIVYVDTTHTTRFVQALATEDAFADTLGVPLPDSVLAVANGFPKRTFIKFDVSSLPREASVVRAVLRLTVDTSASSFNSMTVITHALLEPVSGFSTVYGTEGAGSTVLNWDETDGDTTFSMLVTPLVQPLVSGQVRSYGMVIKSTDETSDLDFVVFERTRAGRLELAPQLEILYIEPPLPSYWKDR